MKNKILIFLCLLTLLLVSPVAAKERISLPHPDDLIYKPLRFNPPLAQCYTLDNGIILYILEDHELPLVNVSAVFRSGSVYDPADKAGLSELTHRIMRTGGVKSFNGDALDDLLAFHGISLNFSAEMDMGTAHLSMLKQDIDLGFDIFSQILREPRFAEDKLQLAKDLYIEGLRGIADDPPKFAFREFRKLLYRDNPRGNLYTAQSIRSIHRSDLAAFHKSFFYPQNIMLSITGDVTTVHLETPPLPSGHQHGAIHYIHKEIPQSVIISGYLAPSKHDQDFYAFTILDFIFGSGGFRSRIFHEIRSERGLAYSTGSFYRTRQDYGAFGAYAMTRSSATTTVLSLLHDITNDIKTKGVSKQELSWAKKSLTNSFIFSFESSDQVASQQMMLKYDQLPQDFLKRYPQRISQTTSEELQRTALLFLSKEKTITLVVGNEKAFDKPLSTLGKVRNIKGDL